MMKYNCKRFLSVLLAVCMMFSSIGTQMVYAVGVDGCTCGTDNEIHASDCALMVENQEICTCTPVDGVHQEGCTFYVPPATASEPAPISDEVCTCTPIDGVHQEGCTFYVPSTAASEPAPISDEVCTCTPIDGVHQEGCTLYAAPTCSCTPVDGVHQEGCALYVAPACSCTPVDGVHQEGCALYVAPACSCTPVDGVHQEGCTLYVEPTCSCTPVDGVHQEGCALYVAPTCSCTPVDGVHQESCDLYEAPTCNCTPVDGVHQEGCDLFSPPILYMTSASDAGDEISFSAGIYLDADRTSLVSSLTSAGTTLAGWTYLSDSGSAEDRYLGVSISGLSMESTKQYRLVIEMDKILYINQNNDPSLAYAEVSFTRNSAIIVNADSETDPQSYSTYTPKTYSLSNLTYLISSGTESLTLGLPLRFDVNLWNKQDGASLGDGTTPLLRVYLQEMQTDGSFSTVGSNDVRLLNATVSGKVDYVPVHNLYLVDGPTTATNIIGSEDTLRMVFSHFSSNTFVGGHYISDITVEINIPACTVENEIYRLKYSDFSFATSGGSPALTQTYDESTGVLTISAKNLYFNVNNLFRVFFSAPDALKNNPGLYTFTGSYTVKENGTVVTENKALSIKLDTGSEAILKTAPTAGKANIVNREAVQPLGGLAIKNTAAYAGSGPLLIALEFDSNNTHAVNVTTVNLMCDRESEMITLYYTLIDGSGDPAFLSDGVNTVFTATVANKHFSTSDNTINDSTYQTFTRSDLPAEHQSYYFETLCYTMGNLPGNSSAYHTGASLAPYSAGTIWGYITTDEIPAAHPEHTMTVYRQNADGTRGELLLTAVTETKVDAGTTVSYGLKSATTSASVISAGDSVTIGGTVFVPSFPYSSNCCLNDIRLGIVLPVGVAINAASINATYSGGTLPVLEVTQTELDQSHILHAIQFEHGEMIGFYNEQLQAVANGDTLNFTVQLNSEKTMSTQTITLKECVFVAGIDHINGASGSYSDFAVLDHYDLNSNGSTTDKVGCFAAGTTKSITIQAQPAELVITDELTNSADDSAAKLTMESFADILTYNLHVECTAGGSASGFYYMIPIPRNSMTAEQEFVKKCQVDLKLTKAATITTNQGTALKVLYSTTSITNYSSTLSLTDLTDWSETLPEGKTWQDVTVIKVVAAADEIENGSINVISVPLGYAGEDTEYEHMAGYQIQWSSRGYYHYKIGHNSNSGTKSTTGCTVTLTYTPHDPIRFTLTAAKDGNPTGEGAVSTYSFELPEFILAQQYSVKQISPSNVTLVDADYNFDNATSAEANENFRIKISVKKSDADTGSNPIALQKENDIIGSLDAHSAPVFTFSIENANALSDIVTDRKVTLTLIGDNGVIVPVEITIKRELAAAEPTTSAIVAGKLYAPFEGNTSTAVSCDSAFTAQFVTEYIPKNYTGHTIVFDSALVSGTTITMIDWTDPTALKYYNYTFNGSTKAVKLTAFQGMGSSGAFTESTNADVVMERLLFIVSFPTGGEPIRENTMKLTKNLTTDTTTEESSVLTFTTVQERGFSLSSSNNSVKCGDQFTVSYTSDCSVTDSRYTNRNLSLVIKPSQGSFPIVSRLTVDGTNYYLNAQGYFVVPLKAVQTGNGSVTVSFDAQPSENISIQISLWASATANGAKPLMGSTVAGPISVSVEANVAPSFEVNSMSDRLLEIEDISNPLTVNFSKVNATTVTIELQKKIGADYVTQTTILESVNGKTSADAGQGVFTVSGSTATIKLSSSTSIGTYRLLFTVSSATDTIEVPYNFVVVD